MLASLVQPYLKHSSVPENLEEFHAAYREFLIQQQAPDLVPQAEAFGNPWAPLELTYNDALQRAYQRHVNDLAPEEQDELIPCSETENRSILEEIHDGFRQLSARCPTLGKLFTSSIHTICVCKPKKESHRKIHASSCSGMLGTIIFSGAVGLSSEDYAELLLHEFTHQLLFLDECCHQHFDFDILLARQASSYSAVLKQPRPLDRAFHSILVAAEILMARASFLPYTPWIKVHPPTVQLYRNLLESMSSFKTFKAFASELTGILPRVWTLLDAVEEGITSLTSGGLQIQQIDAVQRVAV